MSGTINELRPKSIKNQNYESVPDDFYFNSKNQNNSHNHLGQAIHLSKGGNSYVSGNIYRQQSIGSV